MNQPIQRRPQFTLRGLLQATAFFGISLGLFLIDRNNPLSFWRYLSIVGGVTAFGAGVGSLFGRPAFGATIAVLLSPAATVAFLLFMFSQH